MCSNLVLGLAFLSGIYLSDTANRIFFLGLMTTYILLAAFFVFRAVVIINDKIKRNVLLLWHVCFTIFLVRVTYLTLTTI